MNHKEFNVRWCSDDQHWQVFNSAGKVVQRFPKNMKDYAAAFVDSLNWIGFRYAEEGLDFGDGSDHSE